LFPIRANTRGSGKSLLADVISLIGTGRAAPHWPQVTDDEEERKRIMSIALAGYPVVHIDNVTHPLGSPALDAALTAESYPGRLLGTNDTREMPLSIVWLASGNNMEFKGDMARRVVPIDLDAKMERPEERTVFTHTPLVPWVREHRARLVVAALTLVQAYFEVECPSQGVTGFGSFEPWSDLIRQALVWAGEPDPCEDRIGLEAKSDPDHERLAGLLDAWHACYGHKEKTLMVVLGDIHHGAAIPPRPANDWDALRDALGAFDRKYDGRSLNSTLLGHALRRVRGKIIGNKRLNEAAIKDHNKIQWFIEQV
jgi:hypothetical protein